jgi:hypothetical protein
MVKRIVFLYLTLCTENGSSLRLMSNRSVIVATRSTDHELMIRQLDFLPASAKLHGYAFGVHQPHHKVSSQLQVRVLSRSRRDVGYTSTFLA